ncbi:hypothetical protein GYH30_012104 [Glycine max]|uniref:Cyclase n=1 Tax=Glycine max TaxID=3847 RepID=K7KP70_SOYBN|nr:hypothetical protein GYH30_012104 [Glycine max]
MNCLSLFTFLYAICAHSITSTTYPSILDMKTGECSLRSISIGDGVLVPPWREVYEERRIFDITHRYVPEMLVWDSTEGLGHHFLWLEKSMKNGSRANNSNMKVGVHTDTHVDALGHIYNNYYDVDFVVDSLDLTLLNGLTLLVDVPRDKNITTEVTKSLNIPRGVSHVLFRTLNTDRPLMFKKEFDTS